MTQVAGLVLAAGRSTRMAPSHKLLEPLGSCTVLSTTLARLGSSTVDAILVVVGHAAEQVGALASRTLPRAAIVHAADHAQGLSATLRAGLAALPNGTDGVLVVLGDMPMVRTDTIDALLERFRRAGPERRIVAPVHRGSRGNPVLWPRALLPALALVAGDSGGRALMRSHADAVTLVAVEDQGVLDDIDTPLALARARTALAGGEA